MSSSASDGRLTFALALLGWILADVSDSWIETVIALVAAIAITLLFEGIESGIYRKKKKEKL